MIVKGGSELFRHWLDLLLMVPGLNGLGTQLLNALVRSGIHVILDNFSCAKVVRSSPHTVVSI
jgi:hypothetical protein